MRTIMITAFLPVCLSFCPVKIHNPLSAYSPHKKFLFNSFRPVQVAIAKNKLGLRACDVSNSEEIKRTIIELKNRPFFNNGVVGGNPCAQAFSEERHLNDEDLDALRVISLHDDYDDDGVPFSARRSVVEILRTKEFEIIAAARAEVLRQFPGIVEPGGGLYPAMRGEACWRDFAAFLRCVGYATAADVGAFSHPDGAAAMGRLYRLYRVPLDAMRVGVGSLRDAAHAAVAAATPPAAAAARRGWPAADAAFAHLQEVLGTYAY